MFLEEHTWFPDRTGAQSLGPIWACLVLFRVVYYGLLDVSVERVGRKEAMVRAKHKLNSRLLGGFEFLAASRSKPALCLDTIACA